MTRNVQRGEEITVIIDGQSVTAYAGETLAAVLLANGVSVFYRTQSGKPRGPYCNMGACFECQVRVVSSAGGDWCRACMTPAADGMSVVTGAQKADG
ncbi:(2Fe-2S)-binding protein [Exilibacterium tricleocarpae]|nr:(2Fe-2S)-binding protein [Exilibacterium tricleocarpae]